MKATFPPVLIRTVALACPRKWDISKFEACAELGRFWVVFVLEANSAGRGREIAWNLNGTVGVNWTRNIFTESAWRYYYVDSQNSGVIYEVAESGLFIGAGVRF